MEKYQNTAECKAPGAHSGETQPTILQQATKILVEEGFLVESVIPDGEYHICRTKDRPDKLKGSYRLTFKDGVYLLGWTNFFSGKKGGRVLTEDQPMSKEDQAHLQATIRQMQIEQEKEDAEKAEIAALQAHSLWKLAHPAKDDAPYLKKKGVKSYGLKADNYGGLYVPLCDADGKLCSLQTISAEGDKRFLRGSKTTGKYFPISGPAEEPLVIAEGYATGASVHEVMGYETWIAFNANNLMHVGKIAREKNPNREIIFAADYDKPNPQQNYKGGVGVAKAKEAANAIAGSVAFPVFDMNGFNSVDFNDLHKDQGADAVKTFIENRIKPAQYNHSQYNHTQYNYAQCNTTQYNTVQEIPDNELDAINELLAEDILRDHAPDDFDDAFTYIDDKKLQNTSENTGNTTKKAKTVGRKKGTKQSKAKSSPDTPTTEVNEYQGERFPKNFVIATSAVGEQGLYKKEKKETESDTPPKYIWLSDPLYVLCRARDPMSENWGLYVRWSDPDKKQHEAFIPNIDLASAEKSWAVPLAKGGLRMSGESKAKQLLAEYLNQYNTKYRGLCTQRTGWFEGHFVLPQKVLKTKNNNEQQNKEPIILQTQVNENPYMTGGTLADWQTIAKLAENNSRLEFAITTALAPIMLYPLGLESGGFNFVGHSSSGKTTALLVGATVWGKGSVSGGYVNSWRATDNGLEGLAELHNDTAIFLDELGQASAKTVKEAAYMLGNGQGKSRSTRVGSLRDIRTWRCLFISSGEIGLASKIQEEGGIAKAGQEVRVADIPADAGAGHGLFENLHGRESAQAFADEIRALCTKYYGHLAEAFITHVLDNVEEVKRFTKQYLDNDLTDFCDTNANGQVLRVARRFLLSAAVGELAISWGILPWQKGRAIAAAKACFNGWLSLRGSMEAKEDLEVVTRMEQFIENNGQSRFLFVGNESENAGLMLGTDEAEEKQCINRAGFRYAKEDTTIYYILPETFKSEIYKGMNAKHAADVLDRKGMLHKGDGNHIMRRPEIDLPTYGRKRCYTIVVQKEREE